VTQDADTVRFVLSGTAYHATADGGWRDDNPRGWARVQAAPTRKVGKGFQVLVEMERDDALDLADYLESVAEVWACMTAEERGDDRPAPIFIAVERIRKAALTE